MEGEITWRNAWEEADMTVRTVRESSGNTWCTRNMLVQHGLSHRTFLGYNNSPGDESTQYSMRMPLICGAIRLCFHLDSTPWAALRSR